MRERVYISGPITGYDIEERREAFKRVQQELETNGGFKYVFNPLENGLPAEAHRSEHMREDLKQLLKCTCIYFMRGWEKSAGCQLEFNTATQIGLSIMTEAHKQWLVEFSIAKYLDKPLKK